MTAIDGLLLIDKPSGITSHGVVARVRRLLGVRKVGHSGTLDPDATGLLVLGVGRGTRLLTFLVGADKEYEATIRLGWSTTTDDAAGEQLGPAVSVTPEHLSACAPALTALSGEIQQVPSAVSAIKVGGERAYDLVRSGVEVDLGARPVTVYAIEQVGAPRLGPADGGAAFADLDIRVACSSGTYVRALARDLGVALGCGAHVVALRRTRLGPFDLAEAVALESLTEEVTSGCVCGLGRSAMRFLPAHQVVGDDVVRVRNGVRLPVPAGLGAGTAAALLDPTGRLLAVGHRGADDLWRYDCVFC